jgi:hypothetical protein
MVLNFFLFRDEDKVLMYVYSTLHKMLHNFRLLTEADCASQAASVTYIL